MKKILFLLPLVLTGCFVAPKFQTNFTACPGEGLQSLAFYAGTPSAGQAFEEYKTEAGSRWDFGYDSGDVYAVCTYAGGEDVVQKLPASITACEAAAGLSGIKCTGHL